VACVFVAFKVVICEISPESIRYETTMQTGPSWLPVREMYQFSFTDERMAYVGPHKIMVLRIRNLDLAILPTHFSKYTPPFDSLGHGTSRKHCFLEYGPTITSDLRMLTHTL
jgi:hypothetical protein